MMLLQASRESMAPLAARSPKGRRSGMTLLEVVVALAIFLVALIPISMLVSMGSAQALDVQQQAQASMLCQSKLAEVMVGAEPLPGSGDGFVAFKDPFPTTDNWLYRIEAVEQGEIAKLWKVTVTVRLDRADGKVIETSLAQLVLDPAQRGSTLDSLGPPTSSSKASSAASPASGTDAASGKAAKTGPTSGKSGGAKSGGTIPGGTIPGGKVGGTGGKS